MSRDGSGSASGMDSGRTSPNSWDTSSDGVSLSVDELSRRLSRIDDPEMDVSLKPWAVSNVFLDAPLVLRITAALITGYSVGMGVGFIRAGIDLKTLYQGGLLKDSAKGAVIGAGVSLSIWLLGRLSQAVSDCNERRKSRPYDVLADTETNPSAPSRLRLRRRWFLPSPSQVLPWELRCLFASMGTSILGSVISAYALPDKPIVNAMAGRGIGAIAGLSVGVLYQPRLVRLFKRKLIQIPERVFFQESHRDVPFYTRMLCGALAGYMMTAFFLNEENDLSYDKHRLIFTSVAAGLALISPIFFALKRWVSARIFSGDHLNIGGEDRLMYRAISLLGVSEMNLPWYVKYASGVIATDIFVTEYLAESGGGSFLRHGSVQLVLSFLPIVCDAILSTLQDRLVYLRSRFTYLLSYPSPNFTYDFSWYLRLAAAAILGAVLTSAINYTHDDPMQYPQPDHSPFNFSLTVVFGLLAVLTPHGYYASMQFLKSKAPMLLSQEKRHRDLVVSSGDFAIPWYVRSAIGSIGGAIMGTSLSELFEWGDPSKVAAGMIGPGFLQISNAVGAPQGAIAGSVLGLVSPLIHLVLLYAYTKMIACWVHCGLPVIKKPAAGFGLFGESQGLSERSSLMLNDSRSDSTSLPPNSMSRSYGALSDAGLASHLTMGIV